MNNIFSQITTLCCIISIVKSNDSCSLLSCRLSVQDYTPFCALSLCFGAIIFCLAPNQRLFHVEKSKNSGWCCRRILFPIQVYCLLTFIPSYQLKISHFLFKPPAIFLFELMAFTPLFWIFSLLLCCEVSPSSSPLPLCYHHRHMVCPRLSIFILRLSTGLSFLLPLISCIYMWNGRWKWFSLALSRCFLVSWWTRRILTFSLLVSSSSTTFPPATPNITVILTNILYASSKYLPHPLCTQ